MNVRLIPVILLGSVVACCIGFESSYCKANSKNMGNPEKVEQIILALNYFSAQRSLPCKFRVSYVHQKDGRSKVSISDRVGVMAEAFFSKDDFCGNSMRVKELRRFENEGKSTGTEYIGSAALFAYLQTHSFYDDFGVEVVSHTNRSVSVFFDSSSLRIGAHCSVTVSLMKDKKVFCFAPGQ
ncbi:MAG TPA: hypothetical protein P5527_02220 [Kiritimatiellia bacterium]|nr:hypothetical protein [Kiritimatiellia bacterium]